MQTDPERCAFIITPPGTELRFPCNMMHVSGTRFCAQHSRASVPLPLRDGERYFDTTEQVTKRWNATAQRWENEGHDDDKNTNA